MDVVKQIQTSLKDQPSRLPVESWQPDLSGDIDICIDESGQWFHEGVAMQRKALVRLFASILRREEDGHYYLVTPVEKWRIRVLDVPLQVVDVEVLDEGGGQQQLIFVSNVGSKVLLSTEYPLRVDFDPDTQKPSPYISFERGLQAKIQRSVFYRLVDLAFERDGRLWLKSDGMDFELGPL